MAVTIQPQDTPETLAQRLLGDARMTHELLIPGWDRKSALPVGQKAYLKGERQGPPSKNWTKTH